MEQQRALEQEMVCVLTKGLDNYQGTSGNDTIIGSINAGTAGTNAELNTLSALDVIDGGAGVDTLKALSEDGTTIGLGSVKNVEVVEASGAKGVTVDASALADVTNLNVVKAGGAVQATASATADVKVAFAATVNTVADTITVEGGKNVAIALTDVGDKNVINAGTAGKGAAGTVTVESTGKAFANAGDLADIKTFGGTSVSVTQKASADSSAAAASTAAKTVDQGAVTVTGEGKTTEVTVKQDAAVFQKAAVVAVEGVAVQQSVKFSALAKGGSVQIAGLTFTAAKDLTAAEVAQAFANVSKGAAFIAAGDTQASGIYTNGTYIGVFDATWTSAAANGDTVVFTGPKTTSTTLGAITVTGKVSTGATADATATPATVAEGKTAAPGVTGVMGVTNGQVIVNDKLGAESIKTITVDGFDTLNATNTKVLETLNLSNGGYTLTAPAAATTATTSVNDAAKTLALNLEKVGFAGAAATAVGNAYTGPVAAVAATVTIGGTQLETLNVKSTGANAATLSAGSAKALNVTGTGLLTATGSTLGNVETITVKESAGLNLGASVAASTSKLTSVDASATSGNVTMSIDAAKATYLGGTGVDTVTVSTATSAAPVSKAITLGAGDDKLDLSAITAANQIAAGAKFDGGEGTDTLVLDVVAAANDQLSANGTFEKQATGFEKLQLTQLAGTTVKTVNLDNLNDVSYVISGNTAATAPGLAAVTAPTGTLTAGDGISTSTTYTGVVPPALLAGQSVTIAGWTVKAVADASAADVLAVFGGTATATQGLKFDAASITGSFTGWNGVVNAAALDFTATAFATVTAPAITGSAATAATVTLSLTNMLDNGTLELNAAGQGVNVVMKDASGTSDVFNIVTKAASAANVGTVNVDKVETVNIAAASTTKAALNSAIIDQGVSNILTVDADAAKAINVTGAGKLDLRLAADTLKVVTTIDASANTGGLTVSAQGAANAITITGGAGADTLTASTGATAKADVLVGGAGDDVLYVGSNGAKLTGGEGNDVFVVNTATAANKLGTKEATTYTSITDFQVGDVLKLNSLVNAADSFAKLAANLNETTAVFSNFVDAAIAQAAVNTAVWFTFNGNSYVVVDQDTNSTTFTNGVDTVVELVGVDLTNATFNSAYGTVELV